MRRLGNAAFAALSVSLLLFTLLTSAAAQRGRSNAGPSRIAPIAGGILNAKAVSKPEPSYPPRAKAAGVSGMVTVQVIIDESGKVISARSVAGPRSLRQSAAQAAKQARFKPTLLSGTPVKVTGVITYNFVLQ